MDPVIAHLVAVWNPAEDEDDFMVKLRIRSTWDEPQYRALLAASRDALATLGRGGPIPEQAHWILDGKISRTIGLMSHPGFRAEPPHGMSRKEYDHYLDERIKELGAIRDAFLALAGQVP